MRSSSYPRAVAPAVAALLALAAILLGCGTTGDESQDETAEQSRPTPQPAEAEQPLSAAQEHGRDLFVDNCGSCHTLDAAGTTGAVGRDLDEVQLDEAEVLAKIKQGPGSMPSNLLSGKDADDVAAFVAGSGP